MSNLEDKIRGALRPVEPSDGFCDRVLSKLATESQHAQRRTRFGRASYRWMSVALAASVLVAVLIGQQWRVQTEREGMEARRQVIEALRMTSGKLDLAYQVVNNPSPSNAQDEPGA